MTESVSIDRPSLRCRTSWSLLVAALVLLGCGMSESLPETVPVAGTVTLNGKPVEGATVMFHPQDAAMTNPGMGFTGPDGRFELTTFEAYDGALPGTHAISVQLIDPAGDVRSIPGKYGDPKTSGLTAQIVVEGNDVPILLVESQRQ